ncbi:MAG: hypothetical protein H8E37_13565 [Planctomycetes bacterium]|nr:hypothetical protein [Planctomycetota bacterium]
MKRKTYRQCEVRREEAIRLTWLPLQYAVEGRVLRLRTHGEWTDGWIVTAVYSDTERIVALDPHRDISSHRRATSDSQSRIAK